MPISRKISQEKIDKIKEKIKTNSIRGAALYCGVSFYTAWCVSKGKYDTTEPLQPKKELFLGCPITGFK